MDTPLVTRMVAAVRGFTSQQLELHERLLLAQRPWEEEFLHWAEDDGEWVLHGTTAPPRERGRYGVTRGGWCQGRRRAA